MFKCVPNTYRNLRTPVADGWLRRNRRSLLEHRIVVQLELGQRAGNNLGRFLRPRHRRADDFVVIKAQLLQPLPAAGGLLSALLGEITLGIGAAVHVVLTVADQNQVPRNSGSLFVQLFVVPVLDHRVDIVPHRFDQAARVTAACDGTVPLKPFTANLKKKTFKTY